VITGGENVYPAEVEQVLESCPGVEAACVFGIDDDEWGQVVAAALVAGPGRLDEDALRRHLEALAPFKRPRKVFFAGELPLLPNGKVDRRRCREMLRAI
jgi:acyl-CoA synthetase (AMP-forming)/AMP-acid ligase II